MARQPSDGPRHAAMRAASVGATQPYSAKVERKMAAQTLITAGTLTAMVDGLLWRVTTTHSTGLSESEQAYVEKTKDDAVALMDRISKFERHLMVPQSLRTPKTKGDSSGQEA